MVFLITVVGIIIALWLFGYIGSESNGDEKCQRKDGT